MIYDIPKLVEIPYQKQTMIVVIPEFRYGFQEFRN